jgi:hypothetical protein
VRSILLLVLALGAAPRLLTAQLTEGTVVRWKEDRGWIVGLLLPPAPGDSAWRAQATGGPGLAEVPKRLWPVRAVGPATPGLEIRVAPSRRGKGALIGLGTGALAGVVIGLASGDDPESCWIFCYTASEKAAGLALVFAPVGALVGALVAPGPRWAPVGALSARESARTSWYAGREGVGVQVRF